MHCPTGGPSLSFQMTIKTILDLLTIQKSFHKQQTYVVVYALSEHMFVK